MNKQIIDIDNVLEEKEKTTKQRKVIEQIHFVSKMTYENLFSTIIKNIQNKSNEASLSHIHDLIKKLDDEIKHRLETFNVDNFMKDSLFDTTNSVLEYFEYGLIIQSLIPKDTNDINPLLKEFYELKNKLSKNEALLDELTTEELINYDKMFNALTTISYASLTNMLNTNTSISLLVDTTKDSEMEAIAPFILDNYLFLSTFLERFVSLKEETEMDIKSSLTSIEFHYLIEMHNNNFMLLMQAFDKIKNS